MIETTFYAAMTFLVALNPVSLIPMFIAATANVPAEERPRIATRAAAIASVLLVAFAFGGELLFDALGIHLSAFRIAGGLVMLVVGLRMVTGATPPPPTMIGRGGHDVALFPLAMPQIAGPAAIMSAILLTDNEAAAFHEQLAVATVLVAMVGVCYVAMRAAQPLHRMLGDGGANIISRVLGLVLLSVAVEHIMAGLRVELALGGN